MHRTRSFRPGGCSCAPSRLLAALAAALLLTLAPRVSAQTDVTDEPLRPYDDIAARIRATTPVRGHGAQLNTGDTTWVGYRAGVTSNFWSIGSGPARGSADPRGMWTWDAPVHGDSLQGWWPIRMQHTNSSGAVRTDENRPWWAIEIGNQASYVINQGRFDTSQLGTAYAGNRTFGVVGIWHSDPGSLAPLTGVNWTPLAGTRSAWMGLRRHGDPTAVDPVTGNAFTADLTAFNRIVLPTAANSTKQYPGYGSQMDQMLYRDIDLTGAQPDSGVRITFRYRTEMSTLKGTAAASRTGWFEGDPLTINSHTPGNFISAEAGVPTNSLAPVDSFQVYVGAPVEGTWKGSDNVTRPIHDPLRRWFNEVLAKDTRFWKFGRAGADSGEVTVVVTKAEKDAIVAAAGAPRLRVVFRVHTNRDFDDESAVATYSSNGRGAAQVDDVRFDLGAGEALIGDFEGTEPTRDIDNLQPATNAWRSTGKPPAILFHAHDLASLEWYDLCGPLGSTNQLCDMNGVVISMGNHDDDEGAPGALGTTEEAGNWGMVSPTIGLVASPGVKNAFDLTLEEATGSQYAIGYDLYRRSFDLFGTGLAWQFALQSYPTLQADGTPAWGDIRTSAFLHFDPLIRCVRETAWEDGLVATSNASGRPDSIRIVLRLLDQSYRWGISTSWPAVSGYFDNVSLGIVRTTQMPLSADIWDWFQDTFPFNETVGLPASTAFDTTSALIRTGLNLAHNTGNLQRFDVPGDSAIVAAAGADTRVDLVFRVYPGPGNYVTAGARASGLRQVPTSAAAASPGDGSWFGTWMSMPGDFATPGATALHAVWPGQWNPNVWMSARCDTAQMNVFAIDARGIGAVASGRWMSAYHESDPHLAVLGVPRAKCFLVDPAGANDASNITCSSVPAWVSAGGTGYDGSPTTVEGTSIFPDGLFTPGTHLEYFWRRSAESAPVVMTAMCPDTSTVVPQPGEASLDAHRWQEFSVLPDRWKDVMYGGYGAACMLVIDLADRRGDETAWMGLADSVGITHALKLGAHNGWAARGDQSPNDPAAFVASHQGQAGGGYDLYQVKAGELPFTRAGALGSRLAPQDASPTNLVHGKYSKQGPTLEMLTSFYTEIVLLTGDLESGVLGPINGSTSDDRGLLTAFVQGSTTARRRGLQVYGDGFATSEAGTTFPQDVLGISWAYPSYIEFSSNTSPMLDLTTTSALAVSTPVYGMRNACATSPEVLYPMTSMAEVVPLAFYPPLGATTFVAALMKPATVVRPWVAATHGFSLQQLTSRFGTDLNGRRNYFGNLHHQQFEYLCQPGRTCIWGWICDGVPSTGAPLVDGVRLLNTPLARGATTIEFTLAAPDRVTIGLYDIGGRLVRTLAEKPFEAGAQRIAWDGTDDTGRRLNAGVYFARVRYAARGFESARKLIVLK